MKRYVVRICNGDGSKSLEELDRAIEIIKQHYRLSNNAIEEELNKQGIRCRFAHYRFPYKDEVKTLKKFGEEA